MQDGQSQSTKTIKVGLIGAGSMGGALLSGWIDHEILAAGSFVIDPGIVPELKKQCSNANVPVYANVQLAIENKISAPEFLVLAVKPQMSAKILGGLGSLLEGALCLSVMAGVSLEDISTHLGGHDEIIRTMPNLPSILGEGISGLYAPPSVILHHRKSAERLLQVAGQTVWVDHEDHIDMVTAVSGSGPAYFFLMVEVLSEAGQELGLDEKTASQLARATLSGAGAMMKVDHRKAQEMRIAVTSPGGTTAAALEILNGSEEAQRKLMLRAVRAAFNRAQEL